VKLFLEHLSPEIFVHRLAAFSSRWDELIVPAWTSDKMGTHQYIVDALRATGSYQSLKFTPGTEQQSQKKIALAFQASNRAIL
jgi:radical SAM superfamily enzyme